MFKVGEYLVCRRDVCKLIEIKRNHLNNNDYYILAPVFDDSLKIEIPVANCEMIVRPIISKEKVEEVIRKIPNIETIKNDDDRLIEHKYKELINSGEATDLIKVIKTTYLRNKEKTDQKKKIGEKDNNYFNMAERYLYQEFSIVLGISYDDTKIYVIDAVNKLRK